MGRLIKVDDKELKSVSQMKKIAFENEGKISTIFKIEIIRQSKTLTISEPLADMTHGAYDQDTLNDFIKKYY